MYFNLVQFRRVCQIFMKFGVTVLDRMLDNNEFFENRLMDVFHLRTAINYMFTTQFGAWGDVVVKVLRY